MRVTYPNYIDNLISSNIIASSALTDFPAVNVTDQRLSTLWKTDASTTQSIVFDLGSALPVTTIAVLGHNLTSSTTINVYANTSNSWSSPAYSTTLTWNSDIILKFIPSKSYQYWKIEFIGQGNLEIGRIWLSNYLTINPSSLLDFTVELKNSDVNLYDKDRYKISEAGIVWRAIKLKFPPTDNTMLTNLLDWFDMVGLYKSFIFCNFDTIRGYPLVEPLYCSIVSDVGFTHSESMKFSYELSLEEDK
jgi:hypothetical protein